MRVKQTAKKISSDSIINEDEKNNLLAEEKEAETSEHNSLGHGTEASDNEVEFVVECRRDNQGNQFLLDGTLVIEPAEVEAANESKENLGSTKELNFSDFIKEMQQIKPKIGNNSTPKRRLPSLTPNLTIQNMVKCTACNNKFNPFLSENMFSHPLMEVILCKECIQNQKEEFFVIDKDDNKETLCRWCVEGGSLICCDVCPKSFCKTCIKRNLGRHKLSEILNQDETVQWKCFVCDPEPIESLKAACKKINDDISVFNDKNKFQKIAKKPISRLSEVINKKRPLAKAFPNEKTSPNVSAPKIALTQPLLKKMSNTGVLLSNMSTFGTEWYMRNVKLHNIFVEIDEIDSRSLLNALSSTKKCIEAFYSDICNLEVEISKASNASDITSVVSMFKSVYRHHIFNRFCQVKSRIDEDRKSKLVTPTVNGKADYKHIEIKNAHSIPNMVINKVISTTPSIKEQCTTKEVVIPVMIVNNGPHQKIDLMASIDLTDDLDTKSDSLPSPTAPSECRKIDEPSVSLVDEDQTKIVVDLCADDDPVIISTYPVVNLNINNQLCFNGGNSD